MEETQKDTKRGRYHHGDLKAQLIEATRILVEQKGPDHFSVSEACRVAGVSTAAPYKHFKDKDEMLQEVALAGMQRQHRQMREEVLAHPKGSLARIVALGRVYIRFAEKEPGVFRLMFGLSEDHDEHADLTEMGEGTFVTVQQEVAWCRGGETIEEQDVHRAFLLWSFVHGLSFLRIDGKISHMKLMIDLEQVLNDIAKRIITPEE